MPGVMPDHAQYVCTSMLSIACRWSSGTSQPTDCSVASIVQLPDTADGQQDTSLDDVATGSKALLVLWICNHCPFVLAIIGAWVQSKQDARMRLAYGTLPVPSQAAPAACADAIAG